jgi:DNA-binding response OmpR family regulator
VVFSPFGLGVLDLAVGKYVYDQVAHSGDLHVVDDFFHDLSRTDERGSGRPAGDRRCTRGGRSLSQEVPPRRAGDCEVDMVNRILLVEDDATIGEVLTATLRSHGYDVAWERTGLAALARACQRSRRSRSAGSGLPDLDGTELCRRLRRAQPAACSSSSPRARRDGRRGGAGGGRRRLPVKPVRLAELHARLRAHLRRTEAGSTAPAVRRLGGLTVDLRRHRATAAGRELHLRPKEFDLLARLMAQPDVALRRETSWPRCGTRTGAVRRKTLDVHVAAIRRRSRDRRAARAELPRSSRSGATGTGWSSRRTRAARLPS